MIHTNRIVTVGEQESIIDRPIVLYRGDREVEIEFTLVGNEFTFSEEGNVIKSVNASHGQLVLNTPSGEHMFSELEECHEGKVVFVVTKEMIDEFIEMGFYSFQIRLYDSEEMTSRVTIPPVMNGFDIRNPIAAEDETNVVDQGIVDYARIFKDQSNEELPTFDWTGAYNKTEWEHHDVITENKMNKIEDALYSINANIKESDVVMLNTLDQVKRDADAYVTEHMAEVEADVAEFERDLNTDVQQFKIDTNAAMTAHKNEVSEELDGFSGQLEHNTNNIDKLLHYTKEVRLDDFIEEGETVYDNAWVKAMEALSNGGRLILPPKTLNFENNIVCDVDGIEVQGVGDKTKLSFKLGGIEIGNTKSVNRVFFKNFRITSKSNKQSGTVGINFNKNKVTGNAVTDSIFESIHISNFDVGMQMYYVWCNEFRNIRIQPSNKCLSLQSQSNNLKFTRCSFCQWNKVSDCSNLLGVSFFECSMEQADVSFISLFQSFVTFISPYFEFIPTMAELGFVTEANPSHLTIIGGYGICRVDVNGHRQMLSVINGKGNLNVDTDGWYSIRKPIIQNSNTSASYRKPIFEVRGNNRLAYANNKCILNRNGYLIFGNGAQEYFTAGSVYYTLEEGKQYTLVYSVRGDGRMRMSKSGTSMNRPLKSKDEPFELNYSTFIYDGKVFSVSFFGQDGATVELQYLAIYEGQYFEDIPLNDNGGYIGYARTYPTEGEWLLGDRIINTKPTAGSYEGWMCVESGSPGVWKGFGLIEA